MKKIPEMISTKDLAYITDMFNWNMIVVNKLDFYLDNISDEELITKFQSIRDMHCKNANTLCNLLKGACE